MPNYTLCLLLKADLTEGDREKVLQEFIQNLPDSQKPEVISWGKRDLAYPILKETQAFYYLVNFEADGAILATLGKKLRLEDKVIRFLIVKRPKKKIIKSTKIAKEAKATNVTKETKVKKATRVTKEAGSTHAKSKTKSSLAKDKKPKK